LLTRPNKSAQAVSHYTLTYFHQPDCVDFSYFASTWFQLKTDLYLRSWNVFLYESELPPDAAVMPLMRLQMISRSHRTSWVKTRDFGDCGWTASRVIDHVLTEITAQDDETRRRSLRCAVC
jgi:hypothetical protein